MPLISTLDLITHSPDETQAMGKHIGDACAGGEVFLLCGNLGAGKTCFTKGLALGLGIPEKMDVTSPTFVLHCQYPGRLELNHIDAYRLQDAPDITDLGFDELFGAPDCVCVIEWPVYIEAILPPDHLGVHIDIIDETSRHFRLTAHGTRHCSFLQSIQNACAAYKHTVEK